jgi:transcriptional regulator with XRE-family HTH domain
MDVRSKGRASAIQLGKRLLAHREAAGLTQADVAKLTNLSPVTITRQENGNSVPTRRSLEQLLSVYRVRGPEREQLEKLRSKANEPVWLDRFQNDQSITDRYRTYISWEMDARVGLTYDGLLVPGLLQTEDYTRGVIAGATPEVSPADADRLVEVRRRRREVLTKDEPLQLAAVIDEAVLHRIVGSPAVLAAQLNALAKEARPHVTVQVLPFDVGAHPGLNGSFVVLDDFSGSPIVALSRR